MASLTYVLMMLSFTLAAFAEQIKYQVRHRTPRGGEARPSRTLNLPSRYMGIVYHNMRNWSQGRFRAWHSYNQGEEGQVGVANVHLLESWDREVIQAMFTEMALIVLCNIPGEPHDLEKKAAGISQCKKYRDH